jgi:hypothetical protein
MAEEPPTAVMAGLVMAGPSQGEPGDDGKRSLVIDPSPFHDQ